MEPGRCGIVHQSQQSAHLRFAHPANGDEEVAYSQVPRKMPSAALSPAVGNGRFAGVGNAVLPGHVFEFPSGPVEQVDRCQKSLPFFIPHGFPDMNGGRQVPVHLQLELSFCFCSFIGSGQVHGRNMYTFFSIHKTRNNSMLICFYAFRCIRISYAFGMRMQYRHTVAEIT